MTQRKWELGSLGFLDVGSGAGENTMAFSCLIPDTSEAIRQAVRPVWPPLFARQVSWAFLLARLKLSGPVWAKTAERYAPAPRWVAGTEGCVVPVEVACCAVVPAREASIRETTPVATVAEGLAARHSSVWALDAEMK